MVWGNSYAIYFGSGHLLFLRLYPRFLKVCAPSRWYGVWLLSLAGPWFRCHRWSRVQWFRPVDQSGDGGLHLEIILFSGFEANVRMFPLLSIQESATHNPLCNCIDPRGFLYPDFRQVTYMKPIKQRFPLQVLRSFFARCGLHLPCRLSDIHGVRHFVGL